MIWHCSTNIKKRSQTKSVFTRAISSLELGRMASTGLEPHAVQGAAGGVHMPGPKSPNMQLPGLWNPTCGLTIYLC